MNNLDVNGAVGKLETALKPFHTTLASVDQQWADAARREFEETYLAPMEPHVQNMVAAIAHLGNVFSAAQRDCDPGSGAFDV
jgi:hypothetical protein